MKVFAVILALAVISGCLGRLDDNKSHWETAVEKFKDYFTDLSSRADGLVKDIRSSQTGRELDTLIQDVMSELALYKDNVHSSLGPFAQDIGERLGQDLQLQVDRLHIHMAQARERIAEYTQELNTMMEQNADDIRIRVNAYTRKIKKRLSKDTQEINKKIAAYFEQLQSDTSENVEIVKMRMEPYFAQMRDNTEAKVSTLNQLLKTQAEDVKDKLESAAEVIRERFDNTAKTLFTTLEEKIEDLREWFEPYTNMFRDK